MSPKPPYKVIMEYLKEELKNHYSPGDKIPSENELASKFGVSRMTARKAVERLVNEGYLVRIPGLGTFVSEVSKLQKNSMTYVGVAIGDVSDVRGQTIVSEIIKTLRIFSVHAIFIGVGKKYSTDFDRKLLYLLEEKIEGLILAPFVGLEKSAVFGRIAEKVPVIFIDRTIPGFDDIPVVESNNFHGGTLMGKHLKEQHNVRNALFVTEEPLDVSSVNERYLGFKKELNGKVDVLSLANVDDIRKELPEKMKDEFEAIFFCHDLLAVYGMFVLEKSGYRVPKDVKVVSFDDRILAKYSMPSLTTIRQNFGEIGKTAAMFLVRLMKGEKIPQKEHIPVELIVRESCGCGGV